MIVVTGTRRSGTSMWMQILVDLVWDGAKMITT